MIEVPRWVFRYTNTRPFIALVFFHDEKLKKEKLKNLLDTAISFSLLKFIFLLSVSSYFKPLNIFAHNAVFFPHTFSLKLPHRKNPKKFQKEIAVIILKFEQYPFTIE